MYPDWVQGEKEMIKTRKRNVRYAYDYYLGSDIDNIYQAYKKPSQNKVKAFEYCKELCKKHNGENLKIVAKNIYQFSAGFTYKENNKNMFCYITANNDYCTEI